MAAPASYGPGTVAIKMHLSVAVHQSVQSTFSWFSSLGFLGRFLGRFLGPRFLEIRDKIRSRSLSLKSLSYSSWRNH